MLASCALLALAAHGAPAAEPAAAAPQRPFETAAATVAETPLDELVFDTLRRNGLQPAPLCSDSVFLRRAHIDVIGTLPEPEETERFLADPSPGKRAALIEALFRREEFADTWALKWCDVLRVKAEFPINLWPNAAQAYHRWVREAVMENRPYDAFARDLLTSSGSNFRVPQVNFWRAVQGRDPQALARAAALTFMGTRIDAWPEDRRASFAALFSRVAYKSTAEWKEEIVFFDPVAVDAVLPDGTAVRVPPGEDPRRVFADWLLRPGNPWFARAAVNRIWSWFFARGLVNEPDDLRPDNPPTHPELLSFLEAEFVRRRFDVRHVFRLILNSRTYQQSPVPRGDGAAARALFGCYPVRRLDAEVLIDELCWIGGAGERYTSTIPEPYTFVPEENHTIELADGSVTSQLLEMFGRPARDTGLESERNDDASDQQRLHLLNSTDVRRRIERSPRLRKIGRAAKGDAAEFVRLTYLTLLSRPPEPAELGAALAYIRTKDRDRRQRAADLAWALVNSTEFLFRH